MKSKKILRPGLSWYFLVNLTNPRCKRILSNSCMVTTSVTETSFKEISMELHKKYPGFVMIKSVIQF